MLAKQRQAVILEEVRRSGGVRVSDLTELLQVSDMTIRRDLDVLAEGGLVEKVHGGATAVGERSTFEPGFEAKSFRERVEKEAIAELAATLVRPGSAIGLNAGTTTWALASRLGEVPNLTVVTNSIQVAGVFHQHDRGDQTVVLTGGLRTPSDALVGPVAIGSIRSLNLDVVFMGVHGMDPRRGFSTPNLMEAEANRALAEAARRVVVVADHTKWGVIGLCSILRLDQADALVTDAGLGEEARELLAEEVGELLVAPVPGQAAEAG
jgi:DeoR/GlpR family transcriptional regulator of sugar metabolism